LICKQINLRVKEKYTCITILRSGLIKNYSVYNWLSSLWHNSVWLTEATYLLPTPSGLSGDPIWCFPSTSIRRSTPFVCPTDDWLTCDVLVPCPWFPALRLFSSPTHFCYEGKAGLHMWIEIIRCIWVHW
jgi:hypothetical protein